MGFDIVVDPTESKDLASEKPELLRKIVEVCDAYANETGIISPDFTAFELPATLTDIDKAHLEALSSMEVQ